MLCYFSVVFLLCTRNLWYGFCFNSCQLIISENRYFEIISYHFINQEKRFGDIMTTIRIPVILYSDVVQPTKILVKNSFIYQDKRHPNQHLYSLNNPTIGNAKISNCNAQESNHVVANNFLSFKENTIIKID